MKIEYEINEEVLKDPKKTELEEALEDYPIAG